MTPYLQLPQEAAWRVDQSIPPSWPDKGGITFQNFETRYRPGLSLVLHNITCFIKPAEKVCIYSSYIQVVFQIYIERWRELAAKKIQSPQKKSTHWLKSICRDLLSF